MHIISENEEETRIKEEIRKILKGEIDDTGVNMRRGTQIVQKKRRKSVIDKNNDEADKNKEENDRNEVITVVTEDVEVCPLLYFYNAKLRAYSLTFLLEK